MADLPDITRLRAALDVALTTLDSCSRPNSPIPNSKPPTSAIEPVEQSPPSLSSKPPPLAAPKAPDAASLRVRELEDRVKELEQHILRKASEEAAAAAREASLETKLKDAAAREASLETELKEARERVAEYEEKLEQALPLLQTLDQSRTEAREARRRAQITADELSALTCDHQILADELAKCRKESSAVAESEQRTLATVTSLEAQLAARDEDLARLTKQLADDREESKWLQEVAARQAKELEDSISSLKTAAEQQKLENEQQGAVIEQLQVQHKQHQAETGSSQQQMGELVARMHAGSQGLAEEVVSLQQQLLALKQAAQ